MGLKMVFICSGVEGEFICPFKNKCQRHENWKDRDNLSQYFLVDYKPEPFCLGFEKIKKILK